MMLSLNLNLCQGFPTPPPADSCGLPADGPAGADWGHHGHKFLHPDRHADRHAGDVWLHLPRCRPCQVAQQLKEQSVLPRGRSFMAGSVDSEVIAQTFAGVPRFICEFDCQEFSRLNA